MGAGKEGTCREDFKLEGSAEEEAIDVSDAMAQWLWYMFRLVAPCPSSDTCSGAVALQHFSLQLWKKLQFTELAGARGEEIISSAVHFGEGTHKMQLSWIHSSPHLSRCEDIR